MQCCVCVCVCAYVCMCVCVYVYENNVTVLVILWSPRQIHRVCVSEGGEGRDACVFTKSI